MLSPKLLKKLTPDKILEMRTLRMKGKSIQDLSKMFSVHETTVKWHVGDIIPRGIIVDKYFIEDEQDTKKA